MNTVVQTFSLKLASIIALSLAAGAAGAATGPEPFTEEATARGLVYLMQDYPQAHGVYGFGIAFTDLDGDGDPDVVALGAADGHVGLFENDGSGNFTDRSSGSGLPLLLKASAAAAGDFDADGDLDLYLTQLGLANVLARNDGSFTFTDVSAAAAVDDPGAGRAAAFADFDGDARLDLYVANYNGIVPGTEEMDNKLYRNLGDGTFEDVSVAQGVDDFGYGFQPVWFDYDRDGDVDLYLSNDRAIQPPLYRGNQLWRNDAGTLVNVSEDSGADGHLFAMGVACGDIDGNRWPDLYITNLNTYEEGFNPLYLNQGDGSFAESSTAAGVDHWIISWGSIFFDFNNDTRLDLFVNNMWERNSLYDCADAFPCTEIGDVAGVGGRSGPTDISFSSAVADIDADGVLDLLVNSLSGNLELFINHEGETRSWIRYRMIDDGPNRFAVGGRVDTRLGSAWQMREVLAGGNSYLGQNELVMHVGLGMAATADEVQAVWPGGSPSRTLTALPAGHTWTLYPPDMLGDADGNAAVDLADFTVLDGCFEIPLLPGCEVMDFNGDSEILIEDFNAFLAVFDGDLADCNANETVDLREILLDQAADDNHDGVPDACDPIFLNSFEPG
jgi:hypothetical protein